MNEYKEYINPIIAKFKKARQTRFAKANNVTIDNIHVHNQIPVWFLVKLFKSQNNIKSRLFKSLSEEQKNNWVMFYNQNKQLMLMTTENHELFHKNNTFDAKNVTWKVNLNEEVNVNKNVPQSNEEIKKKRVRVKKTIE